MTPISDWVDSIQDAYASGRPIALLFDYDGTLTPIVSHPALAVMSESVREYLRQLSTWDGVSVGVISSRGLTDVSTLVGLDGLYYAGCGGGEIDLRGVRVDSPLAEEIRNSLRAAEGEVRNHLTFYPEVWIEPKSRGFTVHFRGASPTTIDEFGAHFHCIMNRFQDLRYLSVCQAFEVSPADGWDKGTAVERILATLPDDVFPVYFGDAENDLPAMAAVSRAGGVTVAIGETLALVAHYQRDSPVALHEDLNQLCDSLHGVSVTDKSVIHRRFALCNRPFVIRGTTP